MRQIEIDKKRADLKILHKLQVQKTKIQIEEAEALAKMRLEEAALDAEEKLLAYCELGSSVTSSRNFRSHRPKTSLHIGPNHNQTKEPKTIKLFNFPDTKRPANVTNTEKVPLLNAALSCQSCNKTQAESDRTKNKVEDKQCKTTLNPTAKEFTHSSILPTAILILQKHMILSRIIKVMFLTPLLSESTILQTYLDRQGRNEYVNLASQIAYDGANLAFKFYENQIRRLMDESPYPERRFEFLRASCVGQPREMVNLFFAPMKAMTTSQRIEKALARLRERYGIPGGLTSEPKLMKIRHGPTISFNASSLKAFNEEPNLLEVYAFAHDELEKLSGQLTLDTAN